MDKLLAVLAQGGTVVTANNRLARSLALAFNRRQAAASLRAWPTPPVVPWRAWLEQLWSTSRGTLHEPDALLLSEHQVRVLWMEVVRETSEDRLPGYEGAAATLAVRAWRLCEDWCLDATTLAREADSDEARQFAAWAQRFEQRCLEAGWVHVRTAVPRLLAEVHAGRLRIDGPVRLAGFDELPALHAMLVEALAGAGVDIALVPAPIVGGASVGRIACSDELAEIRSAARWARARREDEPLAAIGVVVPDLATRAGDVRREFLDVFAWDWRLQPDRAAPVNFSLGEPLAVTGVARTATLILRATGGILDYRELGELLRSPYLPGLGQEREGRANLEMSLRDRIGLRVNLAPLVGSPAATGLQFTRRLAVVLEQAAATPRRQGAAGWAGSWAAALRAAGWPGDRALASDEYQAANAVQSLLDVLRSCDAVTAPMGRQRALALFERLAREQRFQPAGHSEVVQVLGVREAIGQTFDHLWICGLTSDAWPPAAQPEPLIALGLQRRLALPGSCAPRRREHAERQLRWLIGGSRVTIASWPALRDEQPQSASPLLDAVAPLGSGRIPAWPGQTVAESLFAARHVAWLDDDRPPPVQAGRAFRGGASLLERQARCPARAFLEYRLGARELRVPSLAIDAARRGSILHGVLARFVAGIGDHSSLCALDATAQGALVDRLLDVELARVLPLGDPLVRALARLEASRGRLLIERFLAVERSRPGFRVVAAEERPGQVSLPDSVISLQLAIRPDRVDLLPDGRVLVIDYKTGRFPPPKGETSGPRPRSPQLPLYATALGASAMAFVQLRPSGTQWSGVAAADTGLPGLKDAADWTNKTCADWSELRAQWWTALDRIAAEFLAGSFAVDRWRSQEIAGQWALAIRAEDTAESDEPEPCA